VDLIVSHTNADFDALASMVAASLLYPGALMSLPAGADRNVREFLALHGDLITLVPPQDVPLDRVARLIVVETQHATRLGRFAALIGTPGVTVRLYDHHPPFQPTIPAEARIEPYGANTTLMVRLLREAGIPVDPLHATLFALGIYEDTGCLTFSTTTPDDAETVAWLLRQGANLDVVAAFITRALSEAQRAVLHQLLATAETHRVHGIQVLIATADARDNVDELALLAHKLRELESSDAVMALMRLDDVVLLVARSSVDAVNAAAVARHFGGGGHDRAASATIHDRTVAAVREELVAVLEREVRPRVTAATLMSYPVRTIPPDTPMAEAARLMLRYGHRGLTVVDDAGQVVGIIARRDVDRARHHGLGHAPVRGFMGRKVVTIAPETPLPEIERLMIEGDAGRLPVMRDGKLVGIVTRGDVIRAIHGERYATHHTLYRGAGPARNIWALFAARAPEPSRALLLRIAEIATGMGRTIFLVGGAVRDLLVGNETIDLDLLVEGEGIPLAEAVGRELGGRVVTHPKFHTGTVELPDGRTVDLATARTEFYQYPAALPTAEHSSVREDLYRRDFTINAMAMQLNGDEPGRLLDPFGGSRDLAEGIIRVLHTLSFVEDPTRILRAARFAARFGFRMDERTEELARHAIAMELLDRVSGQRIREELRAILGKPFPDVALRRLDDLGLLAALEPEWRLGGPAPEYGRLEDTLAWARAQPDVAAHMIEPAAQRLLLVFCRLTAAGAARLVERLRLPVREKRLARLAPMLPALVPALAAASLKPSELDALLRPLNVPLCLALLALAESPVVWARVQQYLTDLVHVPVPLTGDELKALGVPRGPAFARIVARLRALRLDGDIRTRDDAVDAAKRLLAGEDGETANE